ncbi:MAG TPA: glycosidase, partial [Novosphingobium sp.]
MPLRAIEDEPIATAPDHAGSGSLLTFHERKLLAAPSRVVIRPFHLGWQASGHSSSRAGKLVTDILALPDEVVHSEYRAILSDFSERHWQTERVFDERADEVAQTVRLPRGLSQERRRLIGAYFCHEYSYAAAALMNPSVVEHPDQSGLTGGAVRFVMSLRAVGEGHISSIAFREGIVEPDGSFEIWPQPNVATAVSLTDQSQAHEVGEVQVSRHPESTLSGSVIFPMTEPQRNGLEDLRLVRFVDDDGEFQWIGTYTAYNG